LTVRILLVEDDEVIAKQLAAVLEREKFMVEIAPDGEEGLDLAMIGGYGLVILDIMLPKRDGWSVCSELRRNKDTVPVLMLTARDSVDDRIKGLEQGADDYLPKPFDVRELVARVHALLRRDKVHRTGVIAIADLEIDTRARIVKRGGHVLDLTPREFSLLEALARNQGRTLTRAMILEGVWSNEESLENTVNFHVASLRKKVDAPFPVKLIQTVHGIGYVLRSEGDG
jgi:two-component system copper resistance phosphate regulon response regulator CusR